jgi:hypothetical protein
MIIHEKSKMKCQGFRQPLSILSILCSIWILSACTMNNPDYAPTKYTSDAQTDGFNDKEMMVDPRDDQNLKMEMNVIVDIFTDSALSDQKFDEMLQPLQDGFIGDGFIGDGFIGDGFIGDGFIGDGFIGDGGTLDSSLSDQMLDISIDCLANPMNDCDGDSVSAFDGDCNDRSAEQFSGNLEICDQIDNDCNGQIDGVVTECYTGPANTFTLGTCRVGQSTCQNGVESSCVGDITPIAEICGDGLDNDCTGFVDNGCDQDQDNVTVDQNDCNDQNPMINPNAMEICNGIDDNCNQVVDDVLGACYTGPAGTQNVGICHGGQLICNGMVSSCGGEVLPGSIEICNNLVDDNCNGSVDENCTGNTCGFLDLSVPLVVNNHCLTTTSSASSLITITPRTLNQSTLPADLTLTLNTQPALTVSESGRVGDTWYWVVATPVAVGNYQVSVSATCGGSAISFAQRDQIQVVAAPTANANSELVLGGCSPIDDNFIIVVKDAVTNQPISNAYVMLGNQPQNIYQLATTDAVRGMAGNSPNTKLTNATGAARFKDLGTQLQGPQTLTVGANNYEYVSVSAMNASFAYVFLRPIARPTVSTQKFSGVLSDFDNLRNDGMTDAGLVLPSMTLDDLTSFRLSRLFSRQDCWTPTNTVPVSQFIGATEIPFNIYIPAQNESILGFPTALNEHAFRITDVNRTPDHLVALGGKFGTNQAVNALTRGSSLSEILASMSFAEIGVVQNQASVANNQNQNLNIPLNRTLNQNVTCQIAQTPANAYASCLSIGTWPAALSGRVFLQGIGNATATQLSQGRVANVNITTVDATNAFAGIGYMSAAVALYDNVDPAITNASSMIINQTAINQMGGSVSFNSFFNTMTLTRNGNTFNWNTPVNQGISPIAETCQLEVYQEVLNQYDPGNCTNTNRIRSLEAPLWTIYLPGNATNFSLPTLSATAPRAANQGLVPEDATMNLKMRIKCQNYGGNQVSNFVSVDWHLIQQNLTHHSLNFVDY